MELTVKNSGAGRWTPAYLAKSVSEAKGFLNKQQYDHAVRQVEALCEEADPTHPISASVDAIENFHELRDKYGVLGKINLRVFFWVSQKHHTLIVLGAWKKENEGQTPVRIVKRIKWRQRRGEELLDEHFARMLAATQETKKRR